MSLLFVGIVGYLAALPLSSIAPLCGRGGILEGAVTFGKYILLLLPDADADAEPISEIDYDQNFWFESAL